MTIPVFHMLISVIPILFKIIFELEQILHSLEQHKYLVLFPLCVVEGPIVAVIAGFLCMNGILNPFIAYPVIVAADITGDTICYSIGRWTPRWFGKKTVAWFGADQTKRDRIKQIFDANPVKTISLSKIMLGIGLTGIFLAGRAKVPYSRFVVICLLTSAAQYVIYLTIGVLFGSAYLQINHYLNVFAAISVIIAAASLLFLFIHSKFKKI